VSPSSVFVLSPCCTTAGHMSNFTEPDFIRTLLNDLDRIRSLLKTSFPVSLIIDGMELICGGGYNLEKAAAAAKSAWMSDPIHPSGHTYAKMAT
jgi:hypothetical protein